MARRAAPLVQRCGGASQREPAAPPYVHADAMHEGGTPCGVEPLQRSVHHGIPWRPLETKKTSVDTGVRPFEPSCSGGGGGGGTEGNGVSEVVAVVVVRT